MIKLVCFITFALWFNSSNAQTAKELVGKWQLVGWSHNGNKKDIKDYFRTDQVFQEFMENGKFLSTIGREKHHGKWHLSQDNKELHTKSALMPMVFQIEYFDSEKRIVTCPQFGRFEYKKVEE